eukprot:497442-Pyramimonas_sp.AAC.1
MTGKTKSMLSPPSQSTYLFESVNANGGRNTLKYRVKRSCAHVILAQEIGYDASSVESLYTWAHNRGWKLVAVPGVATGGDPSAGVAVFARAELGLRKPEPGQHVLYPHRLQHVM